MRRAALVAALVGVAVATASVPASPDALTGVGGIDGGQVRASPRWEPVGGTLVVDPRHRAPNGDEPVVRDPGDGSDPYQWQ
jgi:hypothetical protein